MKIAINALSAQVGSALTFLNNFLPALAAHDTSNEYCVILGEWQTALLTEIPERFEKRAMSKAFQGMVPRFVWEQVVLPFHLHKWKVDVLYSFRNITSLFAGCATVVVITNSNPFSSLRVKWTAQESMRHKLVRLFGILSAAKASKVIFLSENSRDLICRKFSLPLKKTEVIYCGWSPFTAETEGYASEFSDYVLTVSALLPHKNIETLMGAFDLLVERYSFSGFLLVVGPIISRLYYDRLLRLRETLAHGDRIVFKGNVSQGELASLYKSARLFVLASLQETVGLPLQEAMGCGVAISAADCRLVEGKGDWFNPFREICGEAADYFNPFDRESICESMQRLLADEKYRAQLVACGLERIKRFSWDLTARQSISIFEELKQ